VVEKNSSALGSPCSVVDLDVEETGSPLWLFLGLGGKTLDQEKEARQASFAASHGGSLIALPQNHSQSRLRAWLIGRFLSFHCFRDEPSHDRRPRCVLESRQPTQVGPCRGIKSQLVCTLTLTRGTSFSTSFLDAGHFVTGSSVTNEGPLILTHGPELRTLWPFVGFGSRGLTQTGKNEVVTLPMGWPVHLQTIPIGRSGGAKR
jgi:hypothetical protein